MRVAVLDAVLHLAAVGGAEVGRQAAPALHQLHHALVGLTLLEAAVDHVVHGQTVGTLGRERALVVDAVLDPAVVVQVHGDAAAQMSHDRGDVLIGLALLPGVAHGGGAGV